VKDQQWSTVFYAHVLARQPTLDVPGMTEFILNESCVLGLMPESGIKKLLGAVLPDPSLGSGIPRAELYLRLKDAPHFHARALEKGARQLSNFENRDWGDCVAYCLDPDGHVLAFADQRD
jgi:hypothetical protein